MNGALEDLLQVLADHTGAALYLLGPDGRVQLWTGSAERLLGFTAAQMHGRPVSDLYEASARRGDASRAELAQAEQRGELEQQGWRIRHTGERLWAHVLTRAVHAPGGQLRGFTQLLHDRSAQLQLETRREQRLQELERSNRDLDDFAALAAHDLQEPLWKLRGASAALEKGFAHALPPEALSLLSRIGRTTGRMEALIDGLLTYSRAQRSPDALELVHLNEILEEVMLDLSAPLEASGAVIRAGRLPSIHADRTAMRRLLQNLLSNSIKFARVGTTPTLQLDAIPEGDAVWKITLRDNGIGFEDRFAERIFGLFQRLQGRSQYEGSGLGLAICRRIVERQGGTISASGTPGVGAVFTIHLPRSGAVTHE